MASAAPTEEAGGDDVVSQSMVEVYHARFDRLLTGGPPPTTRLAALDDETYFLATGCGVQLIQVAFPSQPRIEPGTQGECISRPLEFDALHLRPFPTVSAHRSHTQSVAVARLSHDRVRVASVDARGFVQVTEGALPPPELEPDSSPQPSVKRARLEASNSDASSRLSSCLMAPPKPVEDGWTAVALSNGVVATTSFFGKYVALYDAHRLVRTFPPLHNPATLCWLEQASPLLMTCEQNVVSVWDPRAAEREGLVQRVQPSTAALYSIDATADGLVACGGAEKAVYVLDSRKWRTLGQWKNVMKYEIVHVSFSSVDQSQCYVAGMDHEVICGLWGVQDRDRNASKLQRQGFRGDSRWIGLHRVGGSDTLAAVTEAGHLYTLRHPYVLRHAIKNRGNGDVELD